MEEESKQYNIIAKIKSLLLNYDMAIAYCTGEIDLRQISVGVYEQEDPEGKSKLKQRKIINLKADIEMYESFLNALLQKRKKLTDSLEFIFDRFNNKALMKNVFYNYFIKNYSIEKLKEENINATEEEIKQAINDLKSEIIEFYY